MKSLPITKLIILLRRGEKGGKTVLKYNEFRFYNLFNGRHPILISAQIKLIMIISGNMTTI